MRPDTADILGCLRMKAKSFLSLAGGIFLILGLFLGSIVVVRAEETSPKGPDETERVTRFSMELWRI